MVPTTYIDSHNKTIQSNQYSVTEHFKPTVDTHHGGQLPGVFIFYDLSPIKVQPQVPACLARLSTVGCLQQGACTSSSRRACVQILTGLSRYV